MSNLYLNMNLNVRRAVPAACSIAVVMLTLACDIGRSTRGGGSTLPEVIPVTYEGTGPDGLKQKLFITPPTASPDDPNKRLQVESTVTNTGGLTLTVITRACVLLPGDLSSPSGVIFTPVNPPDCGNRSTDTLALRPGESTATINGVFAVEGTPAGVYSVDVRQLLAPGFLTRFRFRMPGSSGGA